MTEVRSTDTPLDAQVKAVFRRAAWITAISATAAGLLALLFPTATLTILALIVGTYLVVSGILRIASGVTTSGLARSWRTAMLVIGGLLVVAGVLVLNNPIGGLAAVIVITGIGWIIDGVGYVLAAVLLRRERTTWPLAVAGATLIVCGILAIVIPVPAVSALVTLFAVLLLVIGGIAVISLALSSSARRAQR
ncbi:MAG: hypothetical protein CMF56_08725 [Leifsonia sp.]|nr:hypothetical protein [Leifsonia sp.]|tara:strand:- start:43856 stop:44434 length:579 start_codon:yes stop_codon:yes gene_type:complete